MTDTEAALAYLREQFGEGWLFHFVVPPNYTDRMYAIARLPGRRVPDVAVRVEGECMPDPMSAARACVEAWRETTPTQGEAAGLMLGKLVAERAHADTLAEALRLACAMLESENIATDDWDSVLAAHDARRGGE